MSKLTLSEFAERVRGMLWADGWHDLDETADRLEEELSEIDRTRCHEPEELDDGGCYDGEVHPVDDEDYEACRWVRDHGGLDAVRGRLGERKRLVDRCRAYEDALDMMADSLGVERSSDKIVQLRRMRKAAKDLECRLMPGGMEWPRFEDGEPVKLGDSVEDGDGDDVDEGKAFYVTFFDDHSEIGLFNGVTSWQTSVLKGDFVKRPAPKVLDADGVEIHQGDTVWSLGGGGPYAVAGFDGGTPYVLCDDGKGSVPALEPSALTHRAPVLAADGEPLEAGQTVWLLDDGGRAKCECEVIFTCENVGEFSVMVKEIGKYGYSYVRPSCLTHQRPVLDADGVEIREGETVWHVNTGREYVVVEPSYGKTVVVRLAKYDDAEGEQYTPDQLTHERPESWERLEDDATMPSATYCERMGIVDDGGYSPEELMARDLVRRCKELARKENNDE